MNESTAYLPRLKPAMLAPHRLELAERGYTRIDQFLTDVDAARLVQAVEQDTPWQLSMQQGDRVWEAGPEMEQSIGEARLRAMSMTNADQKFRFLFDMARVPDDPAERDARGLTIDQLSRAWSSPTALAIWNTVLGRDDITSVVMKATRYRPGHFLTRHDDGRYPHQTAAFVLSLSDGWLPHWGGQLQILDEAGEVEAVLTPRFNAISLMTVPRFHFVSMVAPFAPRPRYSVTGWLVADHLR